MIGPNRKGSTILGASGLAACDLSRVAKQIVSSAGEGIKLSTGEGIMSRDLTHRSHGVIGAWLGYARGGSHVKRTVSCEGDSHRSQSERRPHNLLPLRELPA
jgi:hypothetical protein